ncbi:MAG: chemotaxis protein CheA [Clostridiales Family XIII bacterium]|jgi:chemotaxis protein histidine kinase CheA|nr:chemotaxis protein CheA [Clostridiales Family XIII bacterium]
MSDDFNNESMLELYLFESTTLLDNLDAMLLQAESSRTLTKENLNEIFRIMHTIKGSSAMMAFITIAEIAHKAEDLFAVIRDGAPNPARFDDLFDLVLRVSEFLGRETSKIQEGTEPSEGNPALAGEIAELIEAFKADAPQPAPGPDIGRMLGGAPTLPGLSVEPIRTTATNRPEPIRTENRQPEPTGKPEPTREEDGTPEPARTEDGTPESAARGGDIQAKPARVSISAHVRTQPIEGTEEAEEARETVAPVAPEGGRILGLEPPSAPQDGATAKTAENGSAHATASRTVVGEPTRAPNSLATYNIHVHFNEGARMENIRAYMLANKLSEMGSVNRTIPENLENNAEATDYIIENGFYISFTTGMFREQIETVAKGTLSVESVAFMRRMPDEGDAAQGTPKPATSEARQGVATDDPQTSEDIEDDGSIEDAPETALENRAENNEGFPPRADARATALQAIASARPGARTPQARASRIVSTGAQTPIPTDIERRSDAREARTADRAAEERPIASEIPARTPSGDPGGDAPHGAAEAEPENETRTNKIAAPVAVTGMSGKPMKQNIIGVDLTKLDSLLDLVGEIVINESMVTENTDLEGLELEHFNKAARQLNKLTNELQDAVMSVRMVPVAMTFQRMRRIVRDMGKRLDKDAELVLMGENTEIDKTILDALNDPIMHLVRNAMDHAIETKEERATAGKGPTGHIVLSARNAGGDIIISVSDDGRGLDTAQILESAAQKNLLKKPRGEYSEKEIFNLLMTPGFSTKEKVTEFSGRGVGMDVVKSNIERIGGTVIVESVKGMGTNILLKIPLTLAIISCMEIKLGNDIFSIPITNIRESFKASAGQLVSDPGGNEMIMIRGRAYPIIRLHEAFGVGNAVKDIDKGILVLADTGDRRGCLLADELIGKFQVVVKSMPRYLNGFNVKSAGISGCTIMGNGEISLIVDVQELLA